MTRSDVASASAAIDADRPDDAASYRAFFSFRERSGAKQLTIEQLNVWLREKGWNPRLDENGFQQRTDQELFVLHHKTSTADLLRVRLREESHLGTWRSELTLTEPHAANGWMTVSVTNSEGRFVGVPRIAGYILDVVDGFDGVSSLTSAPALVTAADVDELAEDLCSEDRAGLLFVAGSADDDMPFSSFRKRVARWTRQVRGLARVVVLDPRATEALRAAVGETHDVAPWTIRTYQPGVDPAVSLDGRRHRVLGIQALTQRSDAQIERLFGRVARAHASARTLPVEVVRAGRDLARLESRLAVSALGAEPETAAAGVPAQSVEPRVRVDDDQDRVFVPQAPSAGVDDDLAITASEAVSAEVASYLAEVDLIRRVLGVASLDESTLRDLADRARRGTQVEVAVVRIQRQLEDQQARVDSLEDEVAAHRSRADESEFEQAIVANENGRLVDQVQWLRRRLSQAKDHGAAYGEIPESAYTRYPENFQELVDRVGELSDRGLIFSADSRRAVAIDDYDTWGSVVRTAWEALLVLTDYVRSRREGKCESGLDGYLTRTPEGFRTVPPKKFASNETGRTMDSWGDERTFPVPHDVDPTGWTVMKAHFKLGRIGMVSPRMYVLDRYGVDGRVYVGYIGKHLTNTKTT